MMKKLREWLFLLNQADSEHDDEMICMKCLRRFVKYGNRCEVCMYDVD